MTKTLIYSIIILIFPSFLSLNANELNFNINRPFEIFLTKESLAENINFYKNNNLTSSLCLKNSDEPNDNSINIKNLNKKNHIKQTFNKTFTDWDIMDEHADRMNDFALIVCKIKISKNI